jgi:hypothetical protein
MDVGRLKEQTEDSGRRSYRLQGCRGQGTKEKNLGV